MQPQRNTLLTAALAASLMLLHADAALARSKKSSSSGDLGIQRDSNGVPIIMKGFRSDRVKGNRADTARSKDPKQQAYRSARIPRGSSTAIVPRLGTTTGQAVQPYNPPRITTPGDRATSAIHSYPLQKGLGNNPTDQQMYIRQHSN
jgi:hypothetical protein